MLPIGVANTPKKQIRSTRRRFTLTHRSFEPKVRQPGTPVQFGNLRFDAEVGQPTRRKEIAKSHG